MNSIIAVGAGPAGSVCAEILAKSGFEVTILEREKIPRYKPCGGAIPKEMVEEFEIPQNIIERSFNSLVLHLISKDETIERKGEGAILWRSDLDAYLTKRACEMGAILQEQTTALKVTQGPEGFQIKTNNGIFKSDLIIAADGANSTVLRAFNWEKPFPHQVALTITHEVKLTEKIINDRLGEDKLHIFFDKKLIGTGYGWLFPKKNVISVGWGCQLNEIRNTHRQFQEFLEIINDKIKDGKVIRQAAHIVPIHIRPFYRNHIIAVGDAAGFVDPLSGKGIIYAAWSGLIAGQVLKKAIDKNNLDEFNQLYKKRLRKAFLNALVAKRDIQNEVYESDENILRFMKLWQNHRSTEIALRLWKNK